MNNTNIPMNANDANSANIKIALAGGGTAGPTVPLLAVAKKLKIEHKDLTFIFIGTKKGPEQRLVKEENIEFVSILTAKWRRYFSIWNFIDLLLLPLAFLQALYIIARHNVKAVFSVGGFVAVPVVWAAKVLGRKIIIHQQDIQIGLANKLCLPFANVLTTTFAEHKKLLPNAHVVGNPVREELLEGQRSRAAEIFHLNADKFTVLIFGGGTGARAINNLVEGSVQELTENEIQVLHITGHNKKSDSNFLEKINNNYRSFEFLTNEMKHAYAIADMVVARAGLSTITELSYLKKAGIVIPIPNNHQELNAKLLTDRNAAIVLDQNELDAKIFAEKIIELKNNKDKRGQLEKNIFEIMPHDAVQEISEKIFLCITS